MSTAPILASSDLRKSIGQRARYLHAHNLINNRSFACLRELANIEYTPQVREIVSKFIGTVKQGQKYKNVKLRRENILLRKVFLKETGRQIANHFEMSIKEAETDIAFLKKYPTELGKLVRNLLGLTNLKEVQHFNTLTDPQDKSVASRIIRDLSASISYLTPKGGERDDHQSQMIDVTEQSKQGLASDTTRLELERTRKRLASLPNNPITDLDKPQKDLESSPQAKTGKNGTDKAGIKHDSTPMSETHKV